MKSYSEIQQQKELCMAKHHKATELHSNLNQIDMLSGEGSKLREKINILRGTIATLNWVMNDNLNGNLYDVE